MDGGHYVSNAAAFLIQAVFGLCILAVMLRFLLQWTRADFYNPISQVLVRVTNPALVPLRRYIPGYGGVDLASVLLLLALQMMELFLVLSVKGALPNLGGLLVWSLAELLALCLYVYLFSILIEVILSWVNPSGYHPGVRLLQQFNAPLLRPARQLIPSVSGIDFSPWAVLIVLQLASMLLVAPLRDIGAGLALG